jgi:hypothetical protein
MGSLNLGHLEGHVRTADTLGAVGGASVAVYIRPTGGGGAVNPDGSLIGAPTLASLYSDQDGDSAIGNPLTTDSNGAFGCFVAPGTYDLRISGGPLSQPYGEQCKQVVAGVSDQGKAGALPGSARLHYVANAGALAALTKMVQGEEAYQVDEGIHRVFDGASWLRVPGRARAYYVADAAARGALTGMVEGDLCYQVDTALVYVYSGAAWVQVTGRPFDERIVLARGVPYMTDPGTSYIDLANLVWDIGGSGFVSRSWNSAEGLPFNKAHHPAGATVRFWAVGMVAATSLQVRATDAVAGAIATSEVSISGTATQFYYEESGDIAGDMASGDRLLRVQWKETGTGVACVLAAGLRIQKG